MIDLKHRLHDLTSTDQSLACIAAELRQLKETGADQHDIYCALEELCDEAASETEEDRILEVMDLVSGFCSPELRVWTE